jgi:CubicO group peptidase (beta-lactamase class C family)
MEPVLRITQDPEGVYDAAGYMLWNGAYHDRWTLIDVGYDRSEGSLQLVDEDLDTLRLRADAAFQTLTGRVHPSGGGEGDRLSFVRAPEEVGRNLFDPRPPGPNGSRSYVYTPPVQVGDGIATGSIYDDLAAASADALVGLIEEIVAGDFGRIESLLISRAGTLLVEEYYYGYEAGDRHAIFSCTKSIASLLLGITLSRFPDVSLDQSIYDFFPEYDSLRTEDNELISVRHVLTMHSGWAWDEIPRELYEEDEIPYVLGRPLESWPGERFEYNSGGTIVLCGLIERLEERPVDELANERVFGPLGITDVYWHSYASGKANCAWGLEMRPRDMLKIGLLVLANGVWDDRQVVPRDWIEESTRNHVAESDFFDYGYHWWVRSGEKKRWWTDTPDQVASEPTAIVALGYSGQYIIVVPERQIVVVLTASTTFDQGVALGEIGMVVDRIEPILSSLPAP